MGKVLESDAEASRQLLAAHAAWKTAGCEGPPPKAPPPPPPVAPATAGVSGGGGGAASAAAAAASGSAASGGDDGSVAMQKAMEGSLPVFLETMVAASLLDVEAREGWKGGRETDRLRDIQTDIEGET